jgi:hypothetical protein
MADAEKNAMFYNNGSGSPVADMYVDDEKMLATTGLIEEMGSGTVKRDLKQRHIVSCLATMPDEPRLTVRRL